MTEAKNLEKDISVARQWLGPVLITAPPEYALAVAHVIAVGDNKKQQRLRMVMCDGAAIVSASLGDRRAIETTTGETVLVVHEVHTLSDAEQAALLLLHDAKEVGHRRIIATSSVCLFDRVKRGTFNASLFYRLNTIHLVGHSCVDRAKAASACCSERLGEGPSHGL